MSIYHLIAQSHASNVRSSFIDAAVVDMTLNDL